MKGSHRIVIESARLKYEFVIRRNLTIIQGDSATGKTTLMDLLSDYRRGNAPIRLESDVPCEVFSGGGERWRAMLELIRDSIVFIDEGNRFIRTKEFADTVRNSSNYFVLITREPLPELPYSIQEIRKSTGSGLRGNIIFPRRSIMNSTRSMTVFPGRLQTEKRKENDYGRFRLGESVFSQFLSKRRRLH